MIEMGEMGRQRKKLEMDGEETCHIAFYSGWDHQMSYFVQSLSSSKILTNSIFRLWQVSDQAKWVVLNAIHELLIKYNKPIMVEQIKPAKVFLEKDSVATNYQHTIIGWAR